MVGFSTTPPKDELFEQFEVEREQFNVMYDLGMHAATEALNTLGRIIETAPRNVPAYGIAALAHAYLLWRLKAMNSQIELIEPGFTELVTELEETIGETLGSHFAAYAEKGRKRIFGA